ncbi:MAG: MFS transporter [Planctomycetes bacterium]|nr:MFS transporter [Planctomycetota bacterium]
MSEAAEDPSEAAEDPPEPGSAGTGPPPGSAGPESAPRYDLRALLLGLVFLHGAFAAGMIPVLNRQLEDWAPPAFALYYAGMVAGQLAICFFARLTRSRRSLGLFELLFAGALLYMGLTLTRWGFVSGRLLEGIGSGLTLPLIFYGVLQLRAWGSEEKRIAFMNTGFALGFAAGPFLAAVGVALAGTGPLLLMFAAAFGICALGLAVRPPAPALPKPTAEAAAPPGFARFWPLFLAKIGYGYLLTVLAGHAQTLFPNLAERTAPLTRLVQRLPGLSDADLSVPWILLALGIVFTAGQVIATPLLRRLGPAPLLIAGPLVLAAGALGLALTGRGEWVFLMSLGHSVLVLLGYRLLAVSPDGPRTFAMFNVATDPGLVIGALFANLGAQGAWGLCLAGLVALALPRPSAPLTESP